MYCLYVAILVDSLIDCQATPDLSCSYAPPLYVLIFFISWISGTWVRSIGSQGNGLLQFQHPRAMTMDHRGYLYIVDKGNHRIQVITSDGTYVTSFGGYAASHELEDGKHEEASHGTFQSPCGIAMDSQQRIYVTDYGNHRIQVFNTDGNHNLMNSIG